MSDALNNALAAVNAATIRADESQQIIAAKCRGLLAGYDARWSNSDIQPLLVEEMREADLFNPETNRKSRAFRTAGKLDVIAQRRGRRLIVDHKTCSQDIGPDAPYWRQLAIEGQATLYILLEWMNGVQVDEALWDVTRKPTIAPKKLTKGERMGVSARRSYCGRTISQESLNALQCDERETLEMYEARLADDCTNERPEWYFQRRTLPRLDNELLEYAQELWEHGQELLHVRNTDRHVRNPGACMLYGTPCKFLGICSGHDSPESDRWQQKGQVHNELPLLNGDGRDVLTNSRIRCFQTCRRKHYYEYELGIERQDEEEKESLFFGSLYHAGLNAWWSSFIQEPCNDSDANGSPVNEVGKLSASQAALIV
jgi:hypothetical protein